MKSDNKKIVNLCPTGTQTTKDNSFAPIFFNEIIDDVLACYEAGFTVVHLHARDEFGLNTSRKDIFQKIIEGIKAYQPDAAICVSLSGRYVAEQSLRTEVLSLRPDLASLTMSSMNFPQNVSVNSAGTILSLIDEMKKYGVNPEIECFDSGMLNFTNYLIKKGILVEPLYVNVILGNLFNAGVDLATVSSIINYAPKKSKICFGGIGKNQLKANVLGILEADGVRIGLEDNLHLTGKNKATNKELLLRLHRLMVEMEVTCMAPAEFKRLGYANKQTDHTGIERANHHHDPG